MLNLKSPAWTKAGCNWIFFYIVSIFQKKSHHIKIVTLHTGWTCVHVPPALFHKWFIFLKNADFAFNGTCNCRYFDHSASNPFENQNLKHGSSNALLKRPLWSLYSPVLFLNLKQHFRRNCILKSWKMHIQFNNQFFNEL